jgi:hypothetical protein
MKYTPMGFLNGSGLDNLRNGTGVGGYLPDAGNVYSALRERVTPVREQTTEFKLELSAQAADGQLALAADVTGPAQFPPELRLRLALIEDQISFIAPNGIRRHDGIVRSMPTGARGVPPKEGQLSYRRTLSLADLKEQLSREVDQAEERYGVEFPVKPLALSKLSLVGFVQHEKTQEILQAKLVPVSGTITFSKTAPEPDAAGAAPDKTGADKPAE